ncbi:tumor necrosis factor receptor superfamily member 14 [Amia ocellicauda]|uniref:tumor necrosis factor receptor superfamily member 14 n=1 Tax=Amia ocellicauda TaxID=2972642 RepID=UPI0034638ACF
MGSADTYLLMASIAVVFLAASAVEECGPSAYSVNGQCCGTCGAGSYVSQHCTPQNHTQCTSCANGSYIDRPNGLPQCIACTVCDTELGLFEKQSCTAVSNTVCQCVEQFYCMDGDWENCHLCRKRHVCAPGQWVKHNGTNISDTICEDCPSGTFSKEEMSQSCAPWTVCTSGHKANGSSVMDVECHAISRTHIVLFIVSVLIVITIVILIILQICRNRK